MKYLKIIHVLVLSVLLLNLTACGRSWCMFSSRMDVLLGRRTVVEGEPDFVEHATRAMISYATTLQHDKHLHLEHSLVYYNKDEIITGFRMDFICQDILEVRQGREKLVDVVQGFLDHINEDPFLCEHLNGGITAYNLNININYEAYWGLYGDPKILGWTLLQDGMVYFYANDVKNREFTWWNSRVEPYYKSLQIVLFSREAEEEYDQDHNPPKSKSFLNLLKDRMDIIRPHNRFNTETHNP